MEGVEGGSSVEAEKKKPPEGEVKSKRKMKTASQLEILEKTYAVETYPSEALRAELSVQLGLSDRQLQMWFCHRRLKDRKTTPVKRMGKDSPAAAAASAGDEMTVGVSEVGSDHGHGHALRLSPFGQGMEPHRIVGRTPGVAVPRISGDVQVIRRYYEPQQSLAELRAIAFVEAQLGEPLREDGPVLGMEFDPLPPDAFGAPIGSTTVLQQKLPGRLFEANLYEYPDAKAIKGSTGPLHEYQFLPQQPTVRAETYERAGPSYQYDLPPDGHNTKATALSSTRPLMPANEQVPTGFPHPVPSLSLLPQEGRQGHLLQSAEEYENVQRKSSFTTISMDAQFSAHPITLLENPFLPSDRKAIHVEDVLRIERKRKSEEAKIAREVEAHEKRIRKELEKQDILRRKREEQMRKEMERHDRERRKEEERLLREKQREEERYQREQRRELERREKYLQKQSIRAEKMRQKEELRREKEVARQKAATERAIARRIAKESVELVDDERLELMELAALSKGLPSLLSLDFETLQNLDLFRDKLIMFPPESVPLKRPFAIEPWKDSEENVGNLLMVWRFLITFADVLGVWPFTLDEFIQALHDYDSRLLGEIHVALLRSIIKDIEDVARTPATPGANQNSAANPGGGHPHIVEGAYAWGFDIRSWQRHLNLLTWPEILRQFGLSAGFGPKLKKKNIEQSYLRDDNEGNDGEDLIANLRNGVAVENAVALMHERGFSNPRRSRHRLTPGTVKFAAFHVLSLEGSRGLTILEVADKIQKSGLRDLTTSKTPEASIAAALSRDSKLFERTAPSTYCVRPMYRKDPADAEAILSAARERIRVFKNGFVDVEDADDAERDEDSESDVAEDPEMDDLTTELNLKKEVPGSPKTSEFNAKCSLDNGKESEDIIRTPQVCENTDESLSLLHSECINKEKGVGPSIDPSVDVTGVNTNMEKENVDIDENSLGEPWVQALMEGDYSDISVEERLNALVSLIGVAIEGNSIRVVLEERLEAANALKKQMWAEAQLDKRRMKEEFVTRVHYSSFTGNKMESNLALCAPESRQSPLVTIDDKSNEMPVNAAVQERSSELHNDMNHINNMPSEANMQMHDLSVGPDNLPYQQPGFAAEKSRTQLKSLIGHKAEEMYVYRSLPLGQDRRRNRYWQFIASASHIDPGSGRIFVELHDGRWRLIDSEEGFYALLASLDTRGIRESHLHAMLLKIEASFKGSLKRNMLHGKTEKQIGGYIKAEAVETAGGADCCANNDSLSSTMRISDSDISGTSTSFTIELGRSEAERNHALKRHQDFDKWMQKQCFNSLVLNALKFGKKRCSEVLDVCDSCSEFYLVEVNHCHSCHKMYGVSGGDLNTSEHAAHYDSKLKRESINTLGGSSCPLRIRLLKLQLAVIEVSVLSEALQHFWTNGHRKSWGVKLQSSMSAEDLLQILSLLEIGVKRDYLSANYETTSELLSSSYSSRLSGNTTSTAETVPVLPWIPRTTAAVALRVMEFDASISYELPQKSESKKDRNAGEFIKLSSKGADVRNGLDNQTAEPPHQTGLFQKNNWVDVGIGLAGLGRGRGSRPRGRGRTSVARSQRRVIGSRAESGKGSSAMNSNSRLGHVLTWKGRPRARGRHKRGRRSLRSRQKPVKSAVESVSGREISKETYDNSPGPPPSGNKWGTDRTRLQVEEDAENASSSGRSEYDDENGLNGGDRYDTVVDDYAGSFDGKEGSDYNIDANEDENDEDDDDMDDDEDEQGDPDVQEYTNGDSDGDGVRNGDGGLVSTSSDYSY